MGIKVEETIVAGSLVVGGPVGCLNLRVVQVSREVGGVGRLERLDLG